jgi:hypothetical protein
MGSDEPLLDLDARDSVAFEPARLQPSRRLRGPLLAGASAAVFLGVVALGVSGRGGSIDQVPTTPAPAVALASTPPVTTPVPAGSGASPGSITLQVLPNGNRLSIIGDIAAEGVTSVTVSVYDVTGAATDVQSLSIRHLGGGFRPDHWPAFAVTVATDGGDTLGAVEAIAYDASGTRLARGAQFLRRGLGLVMAPHVMVLHE